jgi:hypothetical protein
MDDVVSRDQLADRGPEGPILAATGPLDEWPPLALGYDPVLTDVDDDIPDAGSRSDDQSIAISLVLALPGVSATLLNLRPTVPIEELTDRENLMSAHTDLRPVDRHVSYSLTATLLQEMERQTQSYFGFRHAVGGQQRIDHNRASLEVRVRA